MRTSHRNVNAAIKARVGKLAYWVAGWRVLGRDLPLFTVEANGETLRCSFALLSKVRNYGGDFEIAQDVTLLDDEFEMVLFEGRSTFRYVKYFAGPALQPASRNDGRYRNADGRGAAVRSRRRAGVHSDRWRSGGAFAGGGKIVPDALTLLIPPEYRKHVP